MKYVDGFVLVVPRKSLNAYVRMARAAGKVWREQGAIEFKECAGDDLRPGMGIPFPRLAKSRRGETVMFSFIVYTSRAHRDRVNAAVMKDPRLANMTDMPFDVKRMAYGGFKVLVDA